MESLDNKMVSKALLTLLRAQARVSNAESPMDTNVESNNGFDL